MNTVLPTVRQTLATGTCEDHPYSAWATLITKRLEAPVGPALLTESF